MKKPLKKLAFGAAVAAAALQFSACKNRPVTVYGPPEYFNKETTGEQKETPAPSATDFAPEENVPEVVYGPPEDFEPEENIPEVVYGPPEYFETETAGEQGETPAVPPTDFVPEDNVPVCVYGPPEWFENGRALNGPEPVLPKTDPAFDPEANMNEDVYGPPEMFDIEENAEKAESTASAEEKK